MAATGLEARYRQLLRWYPADHRAVHQEEMLAVLMSGAEPGRDRPALREAANLVAGAFRIRLRPGGALSERTGWQDTLAVYTVVGPVLMLAACVLGLLVGLAWSAAGLSLWLGYNGAFNNVEDSHPLIGTLVWVLLAGQGFVAVLALAGLRRSAAVAAALYVVYFGTYAVISATYWTAFPGIGLLIPLLLVAPLTTLVALLASAGPRSGLHLTRGRHWASLAAGSVAAAALMGRLYAQPLLPLFSRSLHHLFDAAAATAIVLALMVAWVSSAHGKRLAVLFGVLALSGLLELALDYFNSASGAAAANVFVPACEALVLCLLAAIVYRTRQRARSDGAGSSEGLA